MNPKYLHEKTILPSFPRTPHLPYEPNAGDDDIVAKPEDVSSVFTSTISVEEKIDGASAGMCLGLGGHPLVRNRSHILNKAYFKDTPAKEQFRTIWNWFYDNIKKFKEIEEAGPYSVFGEWCLAQHGIVYNRLPDWFIAYDLYDFENKIWIAPPKARQILIDAGFVVPVLKFAGEMHTGYYNFVTWANEPAAWSDEKAEGIYVKVHNDDEITDRFKMVRSDFIRGANWNPDKMKRNKRVKS